MNTRLTVANLDHLVASQARPSSRYIADNPSDSKRVSDSVRVISLLLDEQERINGSDSTQLPNMKISQLDSSRSVVLNQTHLSLSFACMRLYLGVPQVTEALILSLTRSRVTGPYSRPLLGRGDVTSR